MNVISGWLLADTGGAAGLVSGQNLPLLLWAGLAALTLSLLVLMCTRWGQAKPLSKCIVLSVFAHILFLAYAYGTRLIFDHPTLVREVPIRLALAARETDYDEQQDPRSEPAPWDTYAAEDLLAPDIVSPPPQQEQMSLPAQAPLATPRFEAQARPQPLPDDDPLRPVPDVPADQPPILEAAPGEVEVELPEPERAAPQAVEPLVPVAGSLPRRGGLDAPSPVTPPRLPRTSLGDLFDESNQLQRLSDLPLTEQQAEAVADRTDTAPATDNASSESGHAEQMRGDGAVAAGAETATGDAATARGSLPDASGTGVGERRRLGDGAPLPEMYQLRAPESRGAMVRRYGGSPETEAAVEAALAWLAASQLDDGHWDASQFGGGHELRVLGHDRQGAGAQADTGITGLALLALLGSGQTHFEGKFRRNIQHGLEYLLRVQRADGSLAGDARLFARMYCHGIASLALTEAYAMTGDHRLQPFAQRAVEYTIRAQHPSTGGWRYQPGDRGDMSQFGWQVMALKSAELGGIQIPAETRAGMLRFLNEVTSGVHGGLASYRRGEQVSRTMTAEAFVCRFFLDQRIEVAGADEASSFMLQERPGDGGVNLYYWYYASLSLFQLQGDGWQQWNESLQRELLRRQRTSGAAAGSWDPDTVWGGYGGRVYATALASLCLEVYYRYLPLYGQQR